MPAFSSRFHWNLQPNRLTQALAAKRSQGAPILDLTQSNPTEAGFSYPTEVLTALADTRGLHYHPGPAGMREAREAVAAYYAARGITVEPERILLTASTSEAYAYLFKLLTNPGDQVLVPRPSYPLFEFLATMESVEVRSYPLTYDGHWAIDVEALTTAVTERTRAIILVNPNNPTGSFLRRDERDALLRLSREHGLALISDEVFSDYAFGPGADRAPSLATVDEGLAFAMSGLSKVAGLPQMKLGWIVVAGAPEDRCRAFEHLEWIADTYLSVGTPVQCAAPRLLAAGEAVQQQIRRRTLANWQFAGDLLAPSAATLLGVEGGWYGIVQVPRIRTEEDWALHLLNTRNVLIQPGFFYDFEAEAFLVVSFLTAPEVFQNGLLALRDCT